MAPEKRTVRVFISSPSDVRPERLLAKRIVARLDREFGYHFHVEAVLWEREPLVATRHFQDPKNIPRASSTDIVVVILWSRLGVFLPEAEFRGAISGRHVTGTEWEFEDALAVARQHNGIPDLLVYRKRAPVTGSLEDDAAVDAHRHQRKLLEDFIGRWFGSAENDDIKAASHSFDSTQEFEERLYEHLAALLERKAGARSAHAAIRWHGAPFRGLESFDLEHAQIFFGRTRARNELREVLARQVAANTRSLLLVVGASGSGKSSLVKAGLLPDLMLPGMLERVALCRHAVLRPAGSDSNPLRALASAILSDSALPELRYLQYDVERLEALLREAPGQALLPISQGLAEAAKGAHLIETAQARLVLIVDQFEEIFNQADISEGKKREFVTALDGLSRSKLVWGIATLRSDFIDRLSELPEFAVAANSDARYFLSPPTDAEFAQMIRQPAREAGLRFEIRAVDGVTLDETIRQAAAKDPNVLPLLSFLLAELWRNRTPDGELTFDSFERLGGLEGALATRADNVYSNQPNDVQTSLPRVLRALVNVEAGAKITARIAPLKHFPVGTAERKLIDAFAAPDARLLVKGEEEGESTVRVTHEALLSHWRRAAASLAEDRDDLELMSRLRSDAARWTLAESAVGESLLLTSGLPLEEARDLLSRRREEIDPDIVRYVSASSNAERTKRNQRRRLVVASFAVLTALSVFALVQWHSAATERASALISQSRFLARDAQNTVDRGDAVTGMLLALEALPKVISRPDRPFVSEAEYALEDAAANQQERKDFVGHESPVYSAAFSPDSRRIVSASYDKTVRVWGVESGAQIAVLRGHEGTVYSAAFSPDGRRIVSASDDKNVRLWDASTGAQIALLRGHTDAVYLAAFSPDGQRVVSASFDRTVRIWKASSGAPIAVLRGHGDWVLSAAFSPDGRRIVSASYDGTVRIWDSITGMQTAVLQGHGGGVNSANFSPDGRRIVSASRDANVRVWNAANGALIAVLHGHESWVNTAAFSPDGRRIVSASGDETVRVWDATSFVQIAVLRGHEDFVESAVFSTDGRRILSSSRDGTVRLWDITNSAQIALLRAHEDRVNKAAFSPNGRRIVSASYDKTVREWDARSGAQLAVLVGHNGWVMSATFSPDGRRIASGSFDKKVRLWDAASGAGTRVMGGHLGWVYSVAFSPDGRRIVSASSDKTVRLWDATSGAPLGVLRGHAGSVASAAFSPNGRIIVSASADKTVRLWNATGGVPITVLRGHGGWVYSAAFSPDGRRIVSASADKTVRLWDASSGAMIAVLRGHNESVNCAAFSPDGRRIVSASDDKTVRVWDAISGAQIASLRGHEGSVVSASFSPDGRRIVSSSGDKTVRLWDAPLAVLRGQALIEAAHAVVPRQLSAAQRVQEFLDK
jgi:WD40 repeat protein